MAQPSDVVAAAQRWIGAAETPKGSNVVPGLTDWYGPPMPGAWCAVAVSRWIFEAFGRDELAGASANPNGFAWCSDGATFYRNMGRTHPSRDAEPGDLLFFEWGTTSGGYDHVGLCIGNDGRGLDTIEGNIGDRCGVFRRTYAEIPEAARPRYNDQEPPAMAATVLLSDPRDGRVWHADGNSKAHVRNMEQVNTLQFLGVGLIENASTSWIDALVTID